MTNAEIVTALLSTLALGVSIWAIFASKEAGRIAEQTSYRVQIVAEKGEALSQFVEATGHLMTDIELRARAIPYRFEVPSVITSFTEDDMRTMQAAAAGWFKSYKDFTTKVNASRDAWPQEVQDKIILTGDEAFIVNACFSTLELMPTQLSSRFWDEKRSEILQNCPSFPIAAAKFSARVQEAIEAMRDDRRKAWNANKPAGG